MQKRGSVLAASTITLALATASAGADDTVPSRIDVRATNKPLVSLDAAGVAARADARTPRGRREVPNFSGRGRTTPGTADADAGNAVLQDFVGAAPTVISGGFPGASNNDNGTELGILIAPPDTDGQVGPSHFVQMVNLLTTIYDKSGNAVSGPFPSNAIWAGIGGSCEPFNQGDPIVLYDETADRWLLSQFAFPDNLSTFSQCVAISQTGDPAGAYNRYEFNFDGFGFNDYPKHGIVNDSITMMANLFVSRGPRFRFGGSFLGVMDKAAMYAGQPAFLIGFNIGTGEFGFVAGDLDGPGNAPALFATAMSSASAFDIWEIDVNWSNESASVNQIASIPITPYDADLCGASREACVPQPNGGPSLEAISDRLMHRLQIRDFGAYRAMLAAHTVDVGGGRAGIRWYELRESTGTWSLYQEGTYAPADNQHRWIPSIAMNSAGDIGLGYMLGGTSTFVSTAAAGQSAAQSGSGLLDSSETICAPGTGVQLDVNRAGDYASTSIDPGDDSFWHTNEVFVETGGFQWSTYVCNFTVAEGQPGGNTPPVAGFTSACTDLACDFTDTSIDSDGSVVAWSWSFGDGATSTSQNPSNIYGAAGTYTVTLTVTDDAGATDSVSDSVTVTDGAGGGIDLAAVGFKQRGLQKVDLNWSGATSGNVDIYRDGSPLITTANDGEYRDNIDQRGGGTYVYEVCEAGTSTCSNTATVVF